MKTYLLDTNAAADCIFDRRGMRERVREARNRGSRIGIGIPVLAELLAGVEQSKSRDRSLSIVERNLHLFRVWPFDQEAARTYARLAGYLKQVGRPIPVMDVMIAAIALNLKNCTVVTRDSDFAAIPGLSIENWVI